MDENNPKFLDYSEDEALLGAGLVAFLHMQGGHNQKTHGNEEASNSITFSQYTEDEIDYIINGIDYESSDDVPNRGEALKDFYLKLDEIKSSEMTKEEKKSFAEINQYLINIGVFKEGEYVAAKGGWGKSYDLKFKGKKYLFKSWIPLVGNTNSELHLPGSHDQKKHGNDVASPSSKAKTKSVKAKKKSGAGLVEVGNQKWENDQPVYKVVSDGEKMFKDNVFSDDGLVLVGLRGEHKGVVLYTRPVTSHQDMLTAFDENSSDIDWAHFYTEFNEDTGKEQLFIDTYYIGYDSLLGNPTDEEIYDNLHLTQKVLIRVGVNPKRMVSILEPRNEFGNRTHFEVKLEELSMSNDLLAELQDEHSTDAMICFKIPDVIRDELKEKYPFIQDVENLHITLVYLGDTRTLDAGSVVEAIINWSTYQAPIKGKLQGLARFVNGEEVDPLVMTFDSKQMPEVYEVLCDFLYGEKIEFHKEHGFIPHMTLAYIPKDEDMPVQTIEPIEINFSSVWLVWNGEWVEVGLSGVLNRLSWSAGDFGLTELHLPGQHDQMLHGNEEASTKDDIRKKISDYKSEIDEKLYSNKNTPKLTFLDGEEYVLSDGTKALGVAVRKKVKDKSGWEFWESELFILPDAINGHKERGYFKNKTIVLGDGIDNTVLDEKDVLLHEIGHHYKWHRVAGEQHWRLYDVYRDATLSNTGFPSRYSKTDIDEFFAESFVAYFRHGEQFKKLNPSMHDLIKNIFEENGVGDISLSMEVEANKPNPREGMIEVYLEDGTFAWIREDELISQDDLELALGLAVFAELHGGEVHKNGTTQEVHGGDSEGSNSSVTYQDVINKPSLLNDDLVAEKFLKKIIADWQLSDGRSPKAKKMLEYILPKTVGDGYFSIFHPGNVTIYRGGSGNGIRSWSTSIEVARGFGDVSSKAIDVDTPALSLEKVLGIGQSEFEVITK